jgi:hypothetical protein
MIGPEGTDNCHKFVDILGLRTIFPLFMKSPRKIKKVGTTEKEHEGRDRQRSQLNLGALEVGNGGRWRGRVFPFSSLSSDFPVWQSNPEKPSH